jgi:two-component system NtrC family response regulator
MARILLFAGDPARRAALRGGLEACGHAVAEAEGGPGATFGEIDADAVLAPAAVADEALRALAEIGSDAVVIALAPPDGVSDAVAVLREGAESFLVEPAAVEQVALVLERALETRRLRRDRARLREQVRSRHVLVGAAPELQVVREVVRRAAPTKATVLVVGESGTGRELVAQAIHEASPRRDAPFVRVNCAALSEQLLEAELFGHEPGAFGEVPHRREGRVVAADGGTLFLHEVARLPPPVQVRLLRLLQRGELERVGGSETIRVDVRVVASSDRELAGEVQAGRFRDDLYYRLNVVTLALPPLRARKADLPALVDHFAARAARERGKPVPAVTPGALSALFAHDWPGNVRELARAIDAAVAACDRAEIGPEHLSGVLHGGGERRPGAESALIPGATLFEIEREAILRTLEDVGGSTTRAAEILGVSVRKIQYRLKEYRAGRRPRAAGAEA